MKLYHLVYVCAVCVYVYVCLGGEQDAILQQGVGKLVRCWM